MNIYDIRSASEWEALLDSVYSDYHIFAAVADEKGEIRHKGGERANLCETIRSVESAKNFICAKTHNTLTAGAKAAGKPMVDFCEAGLAKCIVPLFVDETWIGQISLCGCCVDGANVDGFLISKYTGTPEEDVQGMVKKVDSLDKSKIKELAAKLNRELNGHR